MKLNNELLSILYMITVQFSFATNAVMIVISGLIIILRQKQLGKIK